MSTSNRKYKVSVIIATYNTGKYIAESLDSIFAQTLRDIEIIIIDDGSTDDTRNIIDRYRNKEKKLVYYYQENRGAGPARNYGIGIANGEYLIFMDPDDKYPNSDCIEKLYMAAVQNDVLISAGNIWTNDHGHITEMYCFHNLYSTDLTSRMIPVDEFDYLYGHTRYLVNTDFVKTNEIYFADCRRYEDQIFSIKALCLAGKFYETDYPVYEYRINYKTVQMTYEIVLDMLRGFRITLEWICKYHLKKMFNNNYVDFITSLIFEMSKYMYCGKTEFDEVVLQINEIANRTKYIEKDYLLNKISYHQKKMPIIKEKLKSILNGERPIIIYGAGGNTRLLVRQYASELKKVIGIAVTNLDENVSEIEDIQVRSIQEYIPHADAALVLITPDKMYKKEIVDILEKMHFSHYCWLDFKFLFGGMYFE